MGFSSLIIEFRPISNRIPEYRHFEDQQRIGRHNSRQNHGSSDQEVIVDQVGNLSAAKEAVLILSLHFVQTDLFHEAGILDDFVQC